MQNALLPVNLIGSPINYANRLIGSSITSQSIAHRHLDLNGDGSISLEEMAALMRELGVEEGAGAEAAAELMAAVAQADSGAGGPGVDFPSFLDFCRKVWI